MEGHGRNEIESLDVSQTVGWFTTVTPVLIEAQYENANRKQVRENAKTIKNSLENGLYFRQNRYLGKEEHITFLKQEWEPQISFNYLGQIRNADDSRSDWKIASENFGNSKSENNQRRYEMDAVLIVVENRLEMSLSFSEDRYEKENVESLANIFIEKIRQLIRDKDKDFESEQFGEIDLEDLEEILEEVEFEI